uniref:Uncharacterized protein n=1 Tax=Romanomermis culicivorax TaxID=13658 RepID=A0A915HLH6_ROMCU
MPFGSRGGCHETFNESSWISLNFKSLIAPEILDHETLACLDSTVKILGADGAEDGSETSGCEE